MKSEYQEAARLLELKYSDVLSYFKVNIDDSLSNIIDVEMFKASGMQYPKSVDEFKKELQELIDEEDISADKLFIKVLAIGLTRFEIFKKENEDSDDNNIDKGQLIGIFGP